MDSRQRMLTSFYGEGGEETRLERNRHGQLEYRTTMAYISRYAAPGCRVLEIGAGTGRYSVALAKLGYQVTAVELVEGNLKVLSVPVCCYRGNDRPEQLFQRPVPRTGFPRRMRRYSGCGKVQEGHRNRFLPSGRSKNVPKPCPADLAF